MEERDNIEFKLKELKPIIQQKFHVSNIGYFGSLGTKNFQDDSDVDLLVEFSSPIGWEFVDLKSFLEKKLDRKVDLVTKKALKEQLKDAILEQVKYI